MGIDPEIANEEFEALIAGHGRDKNLDLTRFVDDLRTTFPAGSPASAAHLAAIAHEAQLLADKGDPVARPASNAVAPVPRASRLPKRRRNTMKDRKARILIKIAAPVVALFAVLGIMGSAGALPRTLQHLTSHAAGIVGLTLPAGDDGTGTTTDDQGDQNDQGTDTKGATDEGDQGGDATAADTSDQADQNNQGDTTGSSDSTDQGDQNDQSDTTGSSDSTDQGDQNDQGNSTGSSDSTDQGNQNDQGDSTGTSGGGSSQNDQGDGGSSQDNQGDSSSGGSSTSDGGSTSGDGGSTSGDSGSTSGGTSGSGDNQN